MVKIIRKAEFEDYETVEPKLHNESLRKIVRTMRKDGKKIMKRFNNGRETIKKNENLWI